MSDRDLSNRSASGWYRVLVAGSLAFAALGLLGASLLSKALERGDLPVVAVVRSDQSLGRLAKSAPVGRTGGGQAAGMARINGVDTTATATATAAISADRGGAPCSPESQGVLIVRSVGIDGVHVSSLPSSGGQPPCEAGRK